MAHCIALLAEPACCRPPLPPCCSTASQREYSSPNTLLALRGKAGGPPGRSLELKSLALNRVAPHLMAIGAGEGMHQAQACLGQCISCWPV